MSTESDPEFEKLLQYLATSRGFDFSAYKRSTLVRRTRARMETLHIENFAAYVDRLEADPGEFASLLDMLLINVTGFFRDDDVWEYLQREVVPKILESRAPSEPIRVWSAGCASGEEPFTLAIVFAEVMGVDEALRRLKIFATDVDDDALTTARQATYEPRRLEAIPETLRARYFVPSNGDFVFHQDLRRLVIFGHHDLLQDAPISKLDLLSCRNTLMYLNVESQHRVLHKFFFGLKDDGYLVLGKAETMMTDSPEVETVEPRFRIFRKVAGHRFRNRALAVSADESRSAGEFVSVDERVIERVFDVGPIAQVVLGVQGRLVLANRQAREMLRLTASDIGRLVQDLEFSYRPLELRSLIERAYEQTHPVTAQKVPVVHPGGGQRWYSITVQPLLEGREFLGTIISFHDVTERTEIEEALERSKSELSKVLEELQSANEELETTNEELHSAIEELETTNEEMQSTNEELETMNEELQSTNDELESLNSDLERQTEERDNTNEFLESILRSLRSAVIVVDPEMKVQVWNRMAEEQWGLRSDETKGRYLPNLDFGLPVEQLSSAIHEALTEPSESHVVTFSAVNRRGQSVECVVSVTGRRRHSGDVLGAILVIDTR